MRSRCWLIQLSHERHIPCSTKQGVLVAAKLVSSSQECILHNCKTYHSQVTLIGLFAVCGQAARATLQQTCNEHLLILLIGRAVCDVIVFVDSRAFQCLQCHYGYDSGYADVQITNCQIETWGIDEEEEHRMFCV